MRIIVTESQLNLLYEQLETSQYKRAADLKASQWYWDHIRKEEGLRCKAYKLPGEKRYTIGYGHSSEDVKEGDILGDGENCKTEADELLKKDSTEHADKLRKIFTTWEDEGIRVLITQGMFDALLSLSYNGGAGGLRRSDVIAILKSIGDNEEKYKSAAETIKTYRVSMSGHVGRREKEYERFIKGL